MTTQDIRGDGYEGSRHRSKRAAPFPRCPLPLVDISSGKVTGRICHIKAQKSGGPRYDPDQTDEEQHDLLCHLPSVRKLSGKIHAFGL